MSTTTMDRSGRLTVPADARRLLGLDDETEFEVEVDVDNDALVLRPVIVLRREDAWAYTTEPRDLVARAHRDLAEGRVRSLTEQEVASLGNDDE